MVYSYYSLAKKILFIFLFILTSENSLNANILYEKENVIVTLVELNLYKEIYLKNNQVILSDSKAIKSIVLQKKVLNRMLEKQPELIKKIDENIVSLYGSGYLKDIIERDYLRLVLLRNEFILEYFNKNLNISKIYKGLPQKIPFSKLKKLYLRFLYLLYIFKDYLKI